MEPINQKPIWVDFANADEDGAIRLITKGTLDSLKELNIKLVEDQVVKLSDDEVELNGKLEFRDNIWVVIPDENGIKSIGKNVPYEINNLSKDTKMDDENGNCKQCKHLFEPHIIIADKSDFSKDGEMRCPVLGCDCFHVITFNLNEDKSKYCKT